MNSNIKKFSGYKQAVFVALVTFLAGMNFGAYSLLIVPLAERLGCSIGAAGFPATVETIACFIAGIFAGQLIQKWLAKRCVLIGSLISALFVAGYAYSPSLLVLNIFEAVTGASMAIGYNNGMNAFISEWFIDRREEISGYAIAFIGFGSAAGTLLFGQVYAATGMGTTAAIFAGTGVIALIVYFTLLRSPEEINEKPLGWEKAEELARVSSGEKTTEYGVGFKGAIKSASFYLILFSCLLWALSLVLFPYLATILQTNGVSALDSSRYQTLGQIALAVFCLLIGKITSKFGTKFYVVLAFGSGIIGLVVLALWCGFGGNTGILVLISVLMGSGYAVGTTYGPMVTTKVFGTKDYAKITPIVFGMRCIGLGVGVLLLPAIAEVRGWTISCYLAIGMMVVGLILGLLAVILAPLDKQNEELLEKV